MNVKVLIVDDSKASRDEIAQAIEAVSGIEAIAVNGGFDALKVLPRHRFALIITDVNMPDIDGLETASLIRQYKKSAQTPIVFITAYVDELQARRGYALGVGEVKLTGMVRPDRRMLTYKVDFTKAVQSRRLTMGVADGIVEADGEVIYQVKDMKVALSES